ncbi:MAG: Gfo/Idh/MocA family oxidoreductase [Planctomycetia bacterium]|nr:Gfo/Idh/MocA family oxidoreductase [Planctomycetia bacterium]
MTEKRRISRRGFLGTAAACTLPLFLPGRILGKDGQFSPNETINVGLIGYGVRRSEVGFRPGAKFIAICDCDTRRIPTDNPEIKGFQHYEEMLEMPELDAVSIAAPDHWHTRMTIDACKAGKDVYCEKPLTFSLMESRQIVQAARKYNRVVSSGSQRVMEDFGHFIAPIVMSGAIGDVTDIYAGCAGPPSERTYDAEPVPAELDWDRWLGQAPWFEYSKRAIQCMTWRFNTVFGTGGLGDWGGHTFGGALYCCGMDHIAPKEVYAPHSERNPEDGVVILMENGVKLHHVIGPAYECTKIVGTQGTCNFTDIGNLRPLHAVNIRRYHAGLKTIGDDFLYCMRHRLRPFQDVFYGANVADYGHMCNIAYKYKRDLVWDKEKMEFVGDPEATSMVTRVQRAPYTIEV